MYTNSDSLKIPFTLLFAEMSHNDYEEPVVTYDEETQRLNDDITFFKTWWKTKTGILNSDSVHGDK